MTSHPHLPSRHVVRTVYTSERGYQVDEVTGPGTLAAGGSDYELTCLGDRRAPIAVLADEQAAVRSARWWDQAAHRRLDARGWL